MPFPKLEDPQGPRDFGRYQATENLSNPVASFSSTMPPHSTKPTSSSEESARWIIIGIITVILVLGLWLAREQVADMFSLISDQEALSTYVQSFGAWGPLVLALGQLLQVLVAFIPGHVFLIAGGYVYGLPAGFLLNLFCIVAASQFAFMLARWAGRPLVRRMVSANVLERWYEIGEKRGFVFFTIAFLLPAFPTDAMNFVAGLSGISSRRFLAANILGRLPSAVMLTLIGSHGLEFPTWIWVVIVAAFAALFLSGHFAISKIEQHHAQAMIKKQETRESSSSNAG